MFISIHKGLEKALQTLSRAEAEGRPLTPEEEKICFGTKKERVATARRIERAVERFIASECAHEKRTRHLNFGSYGESDVGKLLKELDKMQERTRKGKGPTIFFRQAVA